MATRKSTGKTKTTAKAAPATTLDDVLAAVNSLREDVTSLVEAVTAEDADVDDEEEGDDEEVEVPDRETVEAMKIGELRALAADLGIEEKKKADILAAMEEFFEDEDEDEDEEEEEEEEEDEDEEDDEDEDEEDEDEADLEEMTLAELRRHAKSVGFKPSDYKGMDKDAIIELIEGGDEEEDEEDDEDEDEEVLDEDALKAMTHKELIGLTKELELKVPAALKKSSAANQKKLVKLILDSGDEDE